MTTRAAVLGLVVIVLVLTLAYPLREYLGQRGETADLRSQQAAAAARVEALEHRKEQLQNPAYIERLARERLHFVLPGETAYVVLGEPPTADEDTAPVPGDATAEPATQPWYSQLWSGTQAAGR